ncbi:MAG: 6-carboxytetrahydropterin synthase [Longimicrobiales bacterium]
MPTLTRRIRFRASHRYRRAAWSEADNRRVFGEQGRSHEHDWTVDVTVRGRLDSATGWTVDLGVLDARLGEIRDRLAGRDVAEALPDFGPSGLQPSTEELARWFWSQVAGRLPDDVALVRVRVAESDDLWAECSVEAGP